MNPAISVDVHAFISPSPANKYTLDVTLNSLSTSYGGSLLGRSHRSAGRSAASDGLGADSFLLFSFVCI